MWQSQPVPALLVVEDTPSIDDAEPQERTQYTKNAKQGKKS